MYDTLPSLFTPMRIGAARMAAPPALRAACVNAASVTIRLPCFGRPCGRWRPTTLKPSSRSFCSSRPISAGSSPAGSGSPARQGSTARQAGAISKAASAASSFFTALR